MSMEIQEITEITEELKSLDFSVTRTIEADIDSKPKPKPKTRQEFPILEKLDVVESELNHVIEARDVLVEAGEVSKVNANMDAYLLSKRLSKEGRNPNTSEKKILARYTGWGGLSKFLRERQGEGGGRELSVPQDLLEVAKLYLSPKEEEYGYGYRKVSIPPLSQLEQEDYPSFAALVQGLRDLVNSHNSLKERIFYSWNAELKPALARLALIKALLLEDEFIMAVGSTINAHYTSREVITAIWKFIQDLGYRGGTVLESSAGVGHFFGLMPVEMRKRSLLIGVEKELISGAILRLLYPQANIQIKGFEEAEIPYSKVDLCVGNVPFGAKDLTPYDAHFQSLTKFSLHNYFISKNLLALRPGGLAVLISSMSSLDSATSREFRNWVRSEKGGNSDFLGAIRLPADAFKENAGTEVTTDVLIFRKRDVEGMPHPKASDFASTVQISEAPRKEKIKGVAIASELVPIMVNEFYSLNPSLMLGKMVLAHEAKVGGLYHPDEQVLIAPENQNFREVLEAAFQSLSLDLGKDFFEENNSWSNQENNFDPTTSSPIPEKVGELVIRGKKVFLVTKGSYYGVKELEEIPQEKIKTKLGGAKKTVALYELVADYQKLKLAQMAVMELEKRL